MMAKPTPASSVRLLKSVGPSVESSMFDAQASAVVAGNTPGSGR